MTKIEEDAIDYIISDMEETEEKFQRFVRIDENTLGYKDKTIKSILTEDYGLEENTSEYSEHKKAFENAEFIYTQVETVYGETTYSEYDPEWDELYEEQEEWEEEFEYKIRMKKIA